MAAPPSRILSVPVPAQAPAPIAKPAAAPVADLASTAPLSIRPPMTPVQAPAPVIKPMPAFVPTPAIPTWTTPVHTAFKDAPQYPYAGLFNTEYQLPRLPSYHNYQAPTYSGFLRESYEPNPAGGVRSVSSWVQQNVPYQEPGYPTAEFDVFAHGMSNNGGDKFVAVDQNGHAMYFQAQKIWNIYRS